MLLTYKVDEVEVMNLFIVIIEKRYKFRCRLQLSGGIGMAVPFSGGIGRKVVICVNNVLNGSVIPSVMVICRGQDIEIVKHGNIVICISF